MVIFFGAGPLVPHEFIVAGQALELVALRFECLEPVEAVAVLNEKFDVPMSGANGFHAGDKEVGFGDVVFAMAGLFFHVFVSNSF